MALAMPSTHSTVTSADQSADRNNRSKNGTRKKRIDTPVSDITETANAWLSDHDLETVRGRVPMVYVDAVPVRVDGLGEVTHIGLLLRAMAASRSLARTAPDRAGCGCGPDRLWPLWSGPGHRRAPVQQCIRRHRAA